MSLLGPWPASAGLPELDGAARVEMEKGLAQMVEQKLSEPPEKHGLAPVDLRIQRFLTQHLADVRGGTDVELPSMIPLDRYGMARAMSLPCDSDSFANDLIKSWRCQNGVLHNPLNDKRTTKGVFHVAEGGLPAADDKKVVPLVTYSRLLDAAFDPPAASLEVPYTANQDQPRRAWVKVLLRPMVCPEVPGFCKEKRMEIRLMAPGSMVANVDFVESVFGNAGDASLPGNDAALDVEHWSGHTGCIILAPHLKLLKKKDLGLPHWDEANERQRRDSMAWKSPDECYNDGGAFKICVRTREGFFVTLLSDNYFGYCKKEVKTQLSFAANLFGSEEEHSGGALAWASISWGSHFTPDHRVYRPNHHYISRVPQHNPYTFKEAMALLGDRVEMRPEGCAVDRKFPDVIYIPEDAVASIETGRVSWPGGEVVLVPDTVYVHPSGYQISLKQHLDKKGWHIVGTVAEPTNCHKPATVSGGGKSEISKLLSDMITFGTVRIGDVRTDLAYTDMIFKRDYSDRFEKGVDEDAFSKKPSLLGEEKSLGSLVKLLTPSPRYTAEYNEWVDTIPPMIRSIVFLVKHRYKAAWGKDWKSHINVQFVDGREGDIVHVDGERITAQYLRIGKTADKRDRKFQLRYDFVPAHKIQTEDDISASMVVPSKHLHHLNEEIHNPSLKLTKNCELRLFQRPDDAIIRGCDTRCELDMAGKGNFMSNFEALTGAQADAVRKDAVNFSQFTEPMQRNIMEAAEGPKDKFVVSSNHFRIVNGKPTANPRYLQVRTDFGEARENHVADVTARLRRRIPSDMPVHFPVQGVLPGRRNNPPDALADGTPIRPLAVFNPLHYQELPELFMEYISSLTGKSPSTTGAGSEGALTKGPFNALRFAADLNTTLVGMILGGYAGFSSAAGYIGRVKVDHDISLLVPELWCRMSEEERNPAYLIKHGYLEKVHDLTFNNQKVLASRLGYRITDVFAHDFLGRIFNSPNSVFDEAMLKPESQDLGVFVDGVNNITEAQARTARAYIRDNTVDDMCPPLKALVYIMADGRTPDGHNIECAEVRDLFTRDHLLASTWYRERLLTKQRMEMMRLSTCIQALRDFLAKPEGKEHAQGDLGLAQRLEAAEKQLAEVSDPAYVDSLIGTAGADPSLEGIASMRAHA
mmetsp:Transcript_106635/g.318736  ORF Transcript_106635/g.318736 Transcript_106635/m.318736 type:complete len:1149 (-) Transcript_106635:64-3510(-)